jgi:glycerophosphoryl diester phosphodiesterase
MGGQPHHLLVPGVPAVSGRAGAAAAAGGPRRVGHKGAHLIVPGNTLASFDAALGVGVDMIEFDVLSERLDGSGRLLLAHDYAHAAERDQLTLEQGLAHLAGPAFAGLEFDLDLKLPGYEERAVAALRAAGLVERTLVSTCHQQSLSELGRIEPRVRRGWSVPRVRRDYTTDLLTAVPAMALLTGYRAWLPGAVARALSAGRCEAIMAHWRVVSARLIAAVAAGGGELYVWTVDDARRIARLAAMGVSAIITNDPRLFAASGVLPPDARRHGAAPQARARPTDQEVTQVAEL